MNLKAVKARGVDVPYTSQLRAGGGSIVCDVRFWSKAGTARAAFDVDVARRWYDLAF